LRCGALEPVCKTNLADEIIEAELFGSAYFNGAVQRRSHRDSGHRTGDIVSRNGLEEHMRQANAVSLGGFIGDTLDELEELRRMNN